MLTLIIKLASIKPRDKIQLLKEHPELKRLFKYCYDPSKQYGVNPGEVFTSGSNRISEDTYQLLDKLSQRVFTGMAAVRAVYSHLATLTLSEGQLFVRILRKDMRCGLRVPLINTAYSKLIPEFKVMLAQKIDWRRIIYPCYASYKLDGLRCVYRQGVFFTRNGKELRGLNHLMDQLKGVMGVNDVLDGELMVPNMNFQQLSGLLRNHKEVPEAVFHLFDLPLSPRSFEYRLGELFSYTLKFSCVELVPHFIVQDKGELLDRFDDALLEGYEGLVIKPLHYTYKFKRSYDWMKLKVIESEDLKVIGFFEGQGKYTGLLGGVIVDFKSVSVRVGSGFSDSERKDIWELRSQYLGRTIEVQYHEITPDGSLRHPRFKGWRFDK